MSRLSFVRLLPVLFVSVCACADAAPARAANVVVAAEEFEFHGDWFPQTTDGQQVLTASLRAAYPAATAVRVPKAERWRLWVCTRDYPNAG